MRLCIPSGNSASQPAATAEADPPQEDLFKVSKLRQRHTRNIRCASRLENVSRRATDTSNLSPATRSSATERIRDCVLHPPPLCCLLLRHDLLTEGGNGVPGRSSTAFQDARQRPTRFNVN
ncbi:jg3960 [Pararge aegeria aegeria]|uniref:Jg3960 protein n=1 Tax=Pararge aegeria aegeria TaxID=348720 RepID=A0A8S4R4G0_9NEOP|nr:jg3960 [Pararge aegeria aegeria]